MDADHADLDRSADFDETFREHYWPMVRSLAVACGDREAAADAVQDAFTRAYAWWRRISRYDHPAGWIRHVALNRLRDHFRHEQRGAKARELLVGDTPTTVEVVVEKPHGGATTPSVPEVTTPTQPQAITPTAPEQEVEHPVPEPGDDNGVDAPGEDVGDDQGDDDGGVTAPVPDSTLSFSSVGGSITVTVTNGVLSLDSSSPGAGFTSEVHDNEPTRVEVRFFAGSTEWRIRIELGSGGLTSEISQHS